jgi:hypothetical protein
VVARFRAALADYGERYAGTVAHEHYVQRAAGRPDRTLDSEFGIARMNGSWLGVRDVVRVNGREISNRGDRLTTLFAKPYASARAMADAIAAESARYNIGPVLRTVNNPAIVLAILNAGGPSPVEFSLHGRPDTSTEPIRIDFRERGSPTVFRTQAGRDEPAEGFVVVEPDSWRMVTAEVRVGIIDRAGAIGAFGTISVSFSDEPRMGVRVPRRMTEMYTNLTGRSFATGEATYDRYRRFDITTSERPETRSDSTH